MTNTFLCPYVNKYMSSISSENSVDFIYWDRHGIDEELRLFDSVFRFEQDLNEKTKKRKKLLLFLSFKRYCEKILNNNSYDRVIILHNYMAVLMRRFLVAHYKRRYLIDIRDYSFEHNYFFYALEKNAIYNSGMAVISSEGYKRFLPKWDYTICHNDPQIDKETIRRLSEEITHDDSAIQISFIGLVRFFEQNRKLLDILGNDSRFRLAFYGQNSGQLQEYARKKQVKNAVFRGRFDPEETIELFKSADIINNYYGNHTPVLDYALSNKLYYAAAFKKPILVCKDTYMHELASKYSFGITLDDKSKDAADQLYQDYVSIDKEAMSRGCEEFLEEVEKDNKVFRDELNAFLSHTIK